MFSQEFHSVVETPVQEVLRHLQALKLVHSLYLLFTLGTSNMKSFVLLLNS
jgi:hypothetical protein